ncbi:hypothetical protein LJR175_007548 [Variovorax sp. LjRoot175]|uniref:hypothetical protein n=1 Tax=Variovorax sp. LjRoot175 TaxID=3342276 RepID=UPI003ECDFF90
MPWREKTDSWITISRSVPSYITPPSEVIGVCWVDRVNLTKKYYYPEGESANTRASYASAMRYGCAWYAARYGRALRLPVPVVIQFIVDHAARKADEDSEAGLVSELPPDVDQALVANDYKTRLGAPALNTLVRRISVLSQQFVSLVDSLR